MEKIKKIATAIRKFFYLKASDLPGYMSAEEIAEAMRPRPMTQEYKDKLPCEFAKTVSAILGKDA